MTVLMDAVDTATAAVPRLYALNSVPASPTYPYGVYSAVLGRGDGYTLDATHGLRHGMVTWQTFGKSANSALDHMDKIVAALLDTALAITGYECTPLRAALDAPAVVRNPDDSGVVGVTLPFTFTATKET